MGINIWSRIVSCVPLKPWTLSGYDPFAGDSYSLPGRYYSRASAERAARRALRELERSQPTEQSGGQDGIQDRVFIVRPDGSAYRCLP